MYVKGNPVLSKMFTHSGLTLNEKGLFYYSDKNPAFYFLITEDHVKIAEIVGFDYVEFDAAKEYVDFFRLLCTNQFFRPSRFTFDPSDGHVRMYKELAEFLAENPHYKGYTTRQVEDMFEPLKEFDFEARYNSLHEIEDNLKDIKGKFNGGSVLRLRPDYDRRNLEAAFDKFNGLFDTSLEKMDFIYRHTVEEIVEEFVKL